MEIEWGTEGREGGIGKAEERKATHTLASIISVQESRLQAPELAKMTLVPALVQWRGCAKEKRWATK